MTDFRVRRAASKDVMTLMRQRHEMFEEMRSPSRREHAVADRAFPVWAKREMAARRLVCFLVETKDGKVVGGGSVWLREVQPYPGFPGGKMPYLMSMYTDPTYRDRGIGTMVVRKVMAWGRTHGYRSMSLHASKMGKPLYRKLGWKQSSEMRVDL